MDERLSDLLRRARATPEDLELRDRAIAALHRAGEDEVLTQQFQFAFRCDADETELRETGPLTADCSRCRETVHRVRTRRELIERVARRQCVQIDPEELPGVVRELVGRDLLPGNRDLSCVVPRWSQAAVPPPPPERLLARWLARVGAQAPDGPLPRAPLPEPSDGDLTAARARLEGVSMGWLVVDVPEVGGGWVARLEPQPGRPFHEGFRFALEPTPQDSHVGFPYYGVLRDGLLRVVPRQEGQPSFSMSWKTTPPAWTRGSVIQEQAMILGRVAFD